MSVCSVVATCIRVVAWAAMLGWLPSQLWAAAPLAVDRRLQIDLFAEAPQIVTPVAAVCDAEGRLLVIENHTHFRPADYVGPETDRLRLVADTDGDGRADSFRTFFEGERDCMDLAVHPDGSVYLATRRRVLRLHDADGDGTVDQQTLILELETEGDYPHNALSGLAFSGPDKLFVGLGENLGAAYELVGSDDRRIAGGGEGGSVLVCDANGGGLARLATGFWNPFGQCVDSLGNLFAVDNDPDARPPCRLLHIVPGGDYGYQFRFGRAGLSPFHAWNGERPGTLPMVAGTGEAPCEMICYRGQGLPADYQGTLLVASWGDHRLEQYRLKPKGASFTAERSIVVQGDRDFRPVGIATAEDGSLYVTDWVSRSYTLHGEGRIWRITGRDDGARHPPAAERAPDRTPPVRPCPAGSRDKTAPPRDGRPDRLQQADAVRHLHRTADLIRLRRALDDDDPFLRTAAMWALVQSDELRQIPWQQWNTTQQRLGRLRAAVWCDESLPERVANLLQSGETALQWFAARWVAERQEITARPALLAALESSETSPGVALACLAAVAQLDGTPYDGRSQTEYLQELVADNERDSMTRIWALHGCLADQLRFELLRDLVDSRSPQLRSAAVFKLAGHPDERRLDVLARVAGDADRDSQERADAVAGLSEHQEQYGPLLRALANGSSPALQQAVHQIAGTRHTAGVSPRGAGKPPTAEIGKWMARLRGAADWRAGRRLFFDKRLLACSQCHMLEGRGRRLGPDLASYAKFRSQRQILEAILHPEQEIAPQFQAWRITTPEGRQLVGFLQRDGNDDASYVDQQGTTHTLKHTQIAAREPLSASVMPSGLLDALSSQQLRDLLEYLRVSADR